MFELLLVAGPSAGGGGSLLGSLLPMALIFVLFYFLLIRPQSQRQKKHMQMLTEIQRGDKVVTSGGILGKVVKTDDDVLTLEIADGIKIKVRRTMIADVTNWTEPANDRAKK